MKVDICIPVHNGSGFIEETLMSALSQVTSHELCVRVTDDKSTDTSNLILHRLQKKFQFELKTHSNNLGLMNTNAEFVDTSNADAMIFLGQDDILPPGHVEQAVSELLKKKVSFVWFNSAKIDADGMEKGLLHNNEHKQKLKSYLAKLFFLRSNFISSCGLIVWRKNLLNAGNWPLNYKNYGEWLLWIRLLQYGSCRFSGSSLPNYRVHNSNLSSTLLVTNTQFIEYCSFCKSKAKNALFKTYI